MTVLEISNMQRELDARILSLHQESVATTFRKRILALLVELGELANETKCFKFWSTKPANERAVILDEYVDGIHFLISLGNDLLIDFSKIQYTMKEVNVSLSEQFLHCYEKIAAFMSEGQSHLGFMAMLEEYFYLGNALGFTFDDVVAGYIKKNQKNHERQDTNY